MAIKATGHVETETEVMAKNAEAAGRIMDSAVVPTDDRKVYDPETDKLLSTEIKKTDDPKITLCMILKNEEDHIRRCLESIKGHVDEIVVVDTGSTDKTMDICREYGAKIYEHPWENSFSKARNQALGYVTTEWILQLDGDEEMDAESAPKIREVVRSAHNSTTNLCYLTLLNRALGSSVDLTTINTGKIIRMGIGAHYVNRIHNKLVCDGDTRITGLKIFHYGYHLSDEIMKAKGERTTKMLLEQLEEMPDDQETNYYLTIQYLREESIINRHKMTTKRENFLREQKSFRLKRLPYILITWTLTH
jgi:glycosyltransferase involved in cell wall biosynthesis